MIKSIDDEDNHLKLCYPRIGASGIYLVTRVRHASANLYGTFIRLLIGLPLVNGVIDLQINQSNKPDTELSTKEINLIR